MLRMTGDGQLLKKLQALGGKGAAAAARKGCRAGAKVVAAKIKADAPRKSGALARSVKVMALKRKKGRVGVRVEIKAENRGFPYPYAVEKGTKRHPGKRLRRRAGDAKANAAYESLAWKVTPRKYAENAFAACGLRALDESQRATLAEIERQASR